MVVILFHYDPVFALFADTFAEGLMKISQDGVTPS